MKTKRSAPVVSLATPNIVRPSPDRACTSLHFSLCAVGVCLDEVPLSTSIFVSTLSHPKYLRASSQLPCVASRIPQACKMRTTCFPFGFSHTPSWNSFLASEAGAIDAMAQAARAHTHTKKPSKFRQHVKKSETLHLLTFWGFGEAYRRRSTGERHLVLRQHVKDKEKKVDAGFNAGGTLLLRTLASADSELRSREQCQRTRQETILALSLSPSHTLFEPPHKIQQQ